MFQLFKNRPGFTILLLIVLVCLVFLRVLGFDFLNFDDTIFILDNPVIANPQSNLIDVWRYNFGQSDYFPLTFQVWSWMHHIWGFNPFVFHLTNLLVHILNVVLVYWFSIRIFKLSQLDEKLKWLASLFVTFAFAIHPLHVESVAWIIDLKDLLYTCFYLAGLLFYWNYLEKGKVLFYVLSIVFAILAIFSKSTGITFIAVVLWLDWLLNRKLDLKSIVNKTPFLLITLLGLYAFGIFDSIINAISGNQIAASETVKTFYPDLFENMHWLVRKICIASFRVYFWIKQTILPYHQNIFYQRNDLLESYGYVITILPSLLVALFWGAYALRNKIKMLWPSVLLFAILLSPALAQTDNKVAVFVPDRYMYFPVLGILMALALLLFSLKRKVMIVVTSGLLIFWMVTTIVYLPSWESSEALYNRAIKIDPGSTEGRLNRASIYIKGNRDDEALADLNALIERGDNYAALSNRGRLYAKNKAFDKALADLNLSLKIKPDNFAGLLNRGAVYLDIDSLEMAKNDFAAAYLLDSTNITLLKNIANLYNKARNYPVVLSFAEKCLAISPDDIDALRMKAISLYFLDENTKALNLFNEVISKNTAYAESWYFRSLTKYKLKDFEGAEIDYQKSLSLDYPQNLSYEDSLSVHLK